MQDIQKLVRGAGVIPGTLDKTALIRAIQLCEGTFDCFATASGQSLQPGRSLWRDDRFATAGTTAGDC